MKGYSRHVWPLMSVACRGFFGVGLMMSTVEEITMCDSHPRVSRKKRFVIVGSGVAGRSCLTELLKVSKEEKDILLIDTNRDALRYVQENIAHVETSCTSIVDFDTEEQTIELLSGDVVEYEKCLLAIGKETGGISEDFMDPQCSQENIIRLESSSSNEQLAKLKDMVSSDRHVTLLGGTWQSISVASYLAQHQNSPGLTTIVLPASGPLHQVIPKYLSEALVQRLKKQGVDVLAYSQVRYIGGKDTLQVYQGGSESADDNFADVTKISIDGDYLVVHVCCSYDSLNTSMFPTDAVVICSEEGPSKVFFQTKNMEGMSSVDWKSSSVSTDRSIPRSWLYKSGLEIDRHGSVIVNRSLLGAENVYIAGDLASYPYHYQPIVDRGKVSVNNNKERNLKWFTQSEAYLRGHDVGIVNAQMTGSLAGKNMARNCGGIKCEAPYYHALAPFSGINLQFFGDCSTSHSSHSFWLKHAPPKSKGRDSTSQSVQRALKGFKSFYGTAGVVFYVDSWNIIKGVLLCGNSGNKSVIASDVHLYRKPSIIDPLSLIGQSASTVQVNGKQNGSYSLKQHAELLINSLFDVDSDKTYKKIINSGQCKDKNASHRNPLHYSFSPPRNSTADVSLGSKPPRSPSSWSNVNNSPHQPWRYSIHSSLTTEPIFYVNNSTLKKA